MTDKINDKIKSKNIEPLSASDEQLLQAFFADNMMAEIPDEGFSDKVMLSLPAIEQERAFVKRRRLEHLWTVVCMAIGVIAAVVCQGWEQILGLFYNMKIDFLLTGSRALAYVADSIDRSQNLLMVLAGFVVLIMVWEYNELADARE